MTTRDCSYFFSGLGIGAGLALIYAPRSGAQVRGDIQDKLNHGLQALRDTKTAAYNAVEREKDAVAAAIEAGKQSYRDATQRGKIEATPAL